MKLVRRPRALPRMNAFQTPQDPILADLCQATVQWLGQVRFLLHQQAMFPERYPDDPNLLPPSFPYAVVRKTLQLDSPFLTSREIVLRFCGFTPHRRLLWKLQYGVLTLGAFLVSATLYHDPYRTVTMRKDLILEALSQSIRTGSVSVLMSFVRFVPVEVDEGPIDYHAVETFWLTTMSCMSYGRRVAPDRYLQKCLEAECGVLVPHPGPDFCSSHR
ncbi:hypothetical protein MSAN_01090000 [Mycena sanguinolenta]|uniref:Uncharacterized protein n=1 Tax=Mycena sanguinolenta TaxID=230812 RepID=A0A8H7DA50_9AGAR|nr:hypothetical protein MSAN_01090000 [Mycena sanguinolenta]